MCVRRRLSPAEGLRYTFLFFFLFEKKKKGDKEMKEEKKKTSIPRWWSSCCLPFFLFCFKVERETVLKSLSHRENTNDDDDQSFLHQCFKVFQNVWPFLYGLLSMIHWIIPSLKLDGAGGGGGRRVYLVSALDWVSRISNFPPQ